MPSINSVLNVIDKASAERDTNIKKFCQSLDKDIVELGRELKEIKSQANVRTSRCIVFLGFLPSCTDRARSERLLRVPKTPPQIRKSHAAVRA